MSDTRFRYVTYIKTTPEKLWHALTDQEVTKRYFGGGGPRSYWTPGAKVLWQMDRADIVHDWDQRVLDVEERRRLSYTWHNYMPEMAEMFGWSAQELAELRREPISQVTFDIEPVDDACIQLTLVHDGFAPDSQMLRSVEEGWPAILSDLKSLLETGSPVTRGF